MGNTDTRGLGFLDNLWNVVEDIINTCLKECITLYYILHGFHVGRITGVAIMELKLTNDLATITQYSLFLVLLKLFKAYDNLDWDYLLTTLDGYIAGPHMCRILSEFWYPQQVVTIKNGYHSLTYRLQG